jgi:hypothetical protein
MDEYTGSDLAEFKKYFLQFVSAYLCNNGNDNSSPETILEILKPVKFLIRSRRIHFCQNVWILLATKSIKTVYCTVMSVIQLFGLFSY